MSNVSAAAVKALRDRTQATYKDCSAALAEANGDMEKAVEILRTKVAGITGKVEGRVTDQGRIGVFIDPAKKVGGIVEVQCETAPSAKNEAFLAMVNDIARHAATSKAK